MAGQTGLIFGGSHMNKYLLLSAAALVAASAVTTGAEAKKATSPTAISFSGYCDGLNISWSGNLYADQHLFTACGYTETDVGVGVEGKKNVNLSDSFYYGDFGENLSWDVTLPLKSGGTWTLYGTTAGTSTSELNGGAYNIGYTGTRFGAPSSALNTKTLSRMPTAVRNNAEKLLASRK